MLKKLCLIYFLIMFFTQSLFAQQKDNKRELLNLSDIVGLYEMEYETEFCNDKNRRIEDYTCSSLNDIVSAGKFYIEIKSDFKYDDEINVGGEGISEHVVPLYGINIIFTGGDETSFKKYNGVVNTYGREISATCLLTGSRADIIFKEIDGKKGILKGFRVISAEKEGQPFTRIDYLKATKLQKSPASKKGGK